MGGTYLALQGLMFNNSVMTAASTIFGAVIVFGLLYLLLERKKKALVIAIAALVLSYGVIYYAMGKKNVSSVWDLPKTIVTERIHKKVQPPVCVQPSPVPVPVPRPRVIRKAPALPPAPPVPQDARPLCTGPFEFLGCRRH